MSTYKNPTLLKGYTNPVSKNKSYGGPDVGQLLTIQAAEAKAAKVIEAANWKIYRDTKLGDAEKRIEIERAIEGRVEGSETGSTGGVIDKQSLTEASTFMANQASDAKIRLETSTGWYKEMDDDIALVNNFDMSLNEMPEIFGAFHNMMGVIGEKSMGYQEGGINPGSLNPYLKIATGIAGNTGGHSGKISYKSKYSKENGTEWFISISGKSVEDLNRSLYEKTGDKKHQSKEYDINLNKIYKDMNDNDGNSYVFGSDAYTITPSNNSDYIKESLRDNKILGPDDLLEKKYLVETQVTEGNRVFNIKNPDMQAVDDAIRVTADEFAEEAAKSPVPLRNWIQSKARQNGTNVRLEETENGSQVYYTPFLRDDKTNKLILDSEGLAQLGEEYQIGDNGFLKQNPGAETESTSDYDKETWTQITNMSRDQLIISNGFNNRAGKEINAVETRMLQKSIQDKKGKPLTPAQLEKQRSRDFINRSIDDVQKQITDGNNPLEAVKKLVNLGDERVTVNVIPNTGFIELNKTNESGTVIKTVIDPNTAAGRGLILRAYNHELPEELQNKIIEEPSNTKLDEYKDKFEKRKDFKKEQEKQSEVNKDIAKAMSLLKSSNLGADTHEKLLAAKDEYAKINIGIREPKDNGKGTMLIIEDVTGGTHTLDAADAKFKQKFEKILRITEESLKKQNEETASNTYKGKRVMNEVLGIKNKENLVEVGNNGTGRQPTSAASFNP